MKSKQKPKSYSFKGQLISVILILSLFTLTFGQIINVPEIGDNELIASSASSKLSYVPGEVLVRFKSEFEAKTKENTLSSIEMNDGEVRIEVQNFEGSEIVSGLRLAKVDTKNTLEAVAALDSRSDVLYAEPNYIYTESVIPNDPSFRNQWGLQNTGQTYATSGGNPISGTPDADIDAEIAWDRTTGTKDVVVGIIDSGVDISHPDLQPNIWINTKEIAGNSIDDDNNGFVDDINGWDFVNNDATVYDGNNNNDERHGTHVAGTVGAKGNNGIGVTGVNWDVSLMILKASKDGKFNSANLISAYNYAKTMKDRYDQSGGANGANLRVLNNSYGGTGRSQASEDAIVALGQSGILFVAAAGNETTDNDLLPHFPSSFTSSNLISVAATDDKDVLTSFSNFGLGSVSLAAPGRFILSTIPGGGFGFLSGTSMACPHVAGAAALIIAANPTIPVGKLRAALVFGSEPLTNLQGKVDSARRLNVDTAMQVSFQNDTTAPAAVGNLAVASTSGRNVTIQFTSPTDNGPTGKAALYQVDFTSSSTNKLYRLYSGIPNAAGTTESLTFKLPYQNPAGTVTVRAIDSLGNSSTASTQVSVSAAAVNPYQQTLVANQALSTGGTALGLKSDDTYKKDYALPFAFPFFGESFNSVTISTNGNLYFSTPPERTDGDADDARSSVEALNAYKMIAGLWDDLRTDKNADDDVYIVTETDRIIFRWKGVTFDSALSNGTTRGENPVNFEIELNRNGIIKLRYGSGNTKLFSVVGISGADPQAYVVSSHTYTNTFISLTNAQTVVFTPSGTTPTPTPTPTPGNNNPDTIGVFRPTNGITYLRNSNTGGFADIDMVYGVNGDTSIAGDWNGDGKDSLGIYRNGVFYLRNSNTTGPADIVFAFGAAGDQPIAGDWDGDGIDTIGVYRRATGVFIIRNSNSAGEPDAVFVLGNPNDIAIAGDWDGDGIDTTGVFRPSNGIIYLKNQNTSGNADIYLVYGNAGDKPMAGDWDGDGKDSVGIYREGVMYLRNSNTQGVADIVFAFGNPGDEPIAGDWDGLP